MPTASGKPGPSGKRDTSRKRRSAERPLVGWREWVRLVELGGAYVKAKVDTGARTSSLHAFDLETFERHGSQWVSFAIHPEQRTRRGAVRVEALVHDRRAVRSSNGEVDDRILICTNVLLHGLTFPIDVTLTRRDAMGFRMLLGREALRRRFVVDPARSFLAGVPEPVQRRGK